MEILKKPYELSLWDDILTFVYDDGYESEEKIEDGHGAVRAQYYKEKKDCIIGSNTMDTPIRAMQSKFTRNVNGSITLTFNMYSHYLDEESNSLIKNPFIDKLVNERKIKLRYGVDKAGKPKWYDLIIKNIQQNSETKMYTYTAKSLFINELSKSGFNLEFSPELENNMGNIGELAKKILEDTDWQTKSPPVLEQTLIEPLYKIILSEEIVIYNMRDGEEKIIPQRNNTEPTIIYAFYEDIINESPYIQLLYREDNTYEINEDLVITNSQNWYIDGITYIKEEETIKKPSFAQIIEISNDFRGLRLVRKPQTVYDAKTNKYVTIYTDEKNRTIYGFTETEYISPTSTKLYITNPYGFTDLTGWKAGQIKQINETVENEANTNTEVSVKILDLVSVPDLRDIEYSDFQDFTSCLKFGNISNNALFNSGIIDNRSKINGFVQGEKYVFRAKYGIINESNGLLGDELRAKSIKLPSLDKQNLKFQVSNYTLSDGVFNINENYFYGTVNINTGYNQDTGYFEIQTECLKSLKYSEMTTMTENLGFFLTSDSSDSLYIESIEFFPYIEIIEENISRPLYPNELREGEVKTLYCYYNKYSNYEDIDSVEFLYRDYVPSKEFQTVYSENYEKIRSITASESNRFNLLQELCEIFECWIEFEVEHEENGTISLNENYRQKKYVIFKEYIENINYAGFKYGINLKSIQRTVDSDGIVTKLIVKNNSNNFATDGFCSIVRSNENPSGENFLLDFDYYIQHRMLDRAQITNDLYTTYNKNIGYYTKLRMLNNERDTYIKEQSGLLTDIAELKASYQTYELMVSQSEQELLVKKQELFLITGYDFETLIINKPPESQEPIDPNKDTPIWTWWYSDNVLDLMTAIAKLKSNISKYTNLRDTIKENLKNAEDRFELLTRILTSREESEDEQRILIEKDTINKEFYQKYSRFLQEGSWISEDYIDDDLYCIDAKSTLHTSGKPKLTYNINVLELSQLEGYENFVFELGDKTTMEDTEFFGWSLIDGALTPRQEEIIVVELISMLDLPEQNQIKVQNYKTKFEDLFQRMAATTQVVEYKTGFYNKASGIVENDGTINSNTLQNSMANNTLVLSNIQDQSVIWDETGITASSPLNPSELVRIVNRGIYLSQDGGLTWTTGITGRGINASYLNAGTIDVEKIRIMKGSFPSFRWDSEGISAYQFKEEAGLSINFNYGKFVRLDQYGLYGINGQEEFSPSSEKDIWDQAKFALTWKGFMLKNRYGNGYVSIDSEEDFVIVDENGIKRIKIGNLGSVNTPIYGISISNASGAVVMETNEDGTLWLKNRLNIDTYSSKQVGIGKLDSEESKDSIHGGRILDANSNFIVYEDGFMKATGGEFTGTIHATGGTIGGIEISEINLNYTVQIRCDSSTVFTKDGQEKILTAILFKGNEEITSNVSYQWFKNGKLLIGETNQTLKIILTENNIDGDGIDWLEMEAATYSCEAKIISSKE